MEEGNHMSNLQLVFKQDSSEVILTDSRRLAEGFGALHKNILQKIEGILAKTDAEFSRLNFQHTPYVHPQNGETYPMYEMTRDGFMHIALTFTNTEKGNNFRVKVIKAFNEMEAGLLKRNALPKTANGLMAQALDAISQNFRELDAKIENQEQKLSLVTEDMVLSAGHQAEINNRILNYAKRFTNDMVKSKFLSDLFDGLSVSS
jgi:Rha family phage regulatory protein